MKLEKRIPEPELMEDWEQARAYAQADFEAPHSMFVSLLKDRFPEGVNCPALDLGCGTCDVTIRFAIAFPECQVHAVDGSEAMLEYGHMAVENKRLSDRIHLIRGIIPLVEMPLSDYGFIFSNSLLHHLKDPQSLWDTVKRYSTQGTKIFIMDLVRPQSTEEATKIVELYSGNEPEVLKTDFYNSLLSAYKPEEVRDQLERASLSMLNVEVVSDRHFIVYGVL